MLSCLGVGTQTVAAFSIAGVFAVLRQDQFSGDDLGSVCVMLPVNHRHLSVAKQMSEALRLCSVKEQTVPQAGPSM